MSLMQHVNDLAAAALAAAAAAAAAACLRCPGGAVQLFRQCNYNSPRRCCGVQAATILWPWPLWGIPNNGINSFILPKGYEANLWDNGILDTYYTGCPRQSWMLAWSVRIPVDLKDMITSFAVCAQPSQQVRKPLVLLDATGQYNS